MPDVGLQDVMVKQGKERMRVTSWQRAGGEGAGLDLFILIDDASDSSLGSQLNSIRDFINTQPPTTSVGIGYMNAGISMWNGVFVANPDWCVPGMTKGGLLPSPAIA